MHIENEDFLDQPADLVYPLVRDEMTRLLPFLPNVEAVTQLTYERTSPTRVDILNEWRAKATLPAIAAKFLPPDIFVWKDYAHWKDDEHLVDYRLEGFGYTAIGTNSFKPDGSGTRIRVSADITIDPARFKIPKLVFSKVFPLVEDTLKKALAPNMTALSRALKDYFAAQK
jgi:hypothetical protein